MNPNNVDPNTATREEFTNDLVERNIPSDAALEWKKSAEHLQTLLKKLAFHQAMEPNLQQTYMTPANSKNKVYFMWDFVGRTLGFLYMVPSTLEELTPRQREIWSDVRSRSAMSAGLILDQPPGMLDQMVQMSYPQRSGQTPDLGDDVREVARQMVH